MISPVPKAPSGDELLRLYAELASDHPPQAGEAAAPDAAAEDVRNVRRALEMLDRLRQSLHSGPLEPEELAADLGEDPPTIGPYFIERELGRGGWGIVYLATDERTGRSVALKLPLLEYAGHPQFGRRFVREAKLLQSLDHPNLIKVYEAGEAGWIWYLALEFCAGPNLKQWLASQGGRIAPRRAATIIAAVADGLEHVHERGVLHRDIKPTNILLDEGLSDTTMAAAGLSFVPRLADFGLAKLTASSGETTHDGMLIGTPAYMSPEQALTRLNEICPASDTFALGVVLYEMVAGRNPFAGGDDLEIRYRVAKEAAPDLSEIGGNVPTAIAAICRKALSKVPAARYATARELAEDLRRYLRGEPVLAPPVPRRLIPKLNRRAALGLAALGAAGLAGAWFRRPREAAQPPFEAAAIPNVPDERLLGDWLFQRSELDGRTVRDRAGRLDATVQGACELVPAGMLQALDFDGQSTLVYLGRSSDNLPLPKESMTAEAWVKVDEPLSWGNLVGLFQDNQSQEHGWCLGYFHDKFSFSLKGAGTQSWMIHLVDTSPFELGAWYHVAGTYDGVTQRLFVNGRLLGETRIDKGPINYPKWGYYEIGCYHDVDEFRTMKGAIHEARVYNAALSPAELAQHFAERRDLLLNVEAPRKRKARVWTSLMWILEPNPGKETPVSETRPAGAPAANGK